MTQIYVDPTSTGAALDRVISFDPVYPPRKALKWGYDLDIANSYVGGASPANAAQIRNIRAPVGTLLPPPAGEFQGSATVDGAWLDANAGGYINMIAGDQNATISADDSVLTSAWLNLSSGISAVAFILGQGLLSGLSGTPVTQFGFGFHQNGNWAIGVGGVKQILSIVGLGLDAPEVGVPCHIACLTEKVTATTGRADLYFNGDLMVSAEDVDCSGTAAGGYSYAPNESDKFRTNNVVGASSNVPGKIARPLVFTGLSAAQAGLVVADEYAAYSPTLGVAA